MTKRSEDDVKKIATTLNNAAGRAVGALIQGGLSNDIATSSCEEAVNHCMAVVNIQNQDSKLMKAAAFAIHCEETINSLLFRLFKTAEVSGITKSNKNSLKIQTIVISNLVGHAIDGCVTSTSTEEEAKELLQAVISVVWKAMILKKINQEMEENVNAKGSSSIH